MSITGVKKSTHIYLLVSFLLSNAYKTAIKDFGHVPV